MKQLLLFCLLAGASLLAGTFSEVDLSRASIPLGGESKVTNLIDEKGAELCKKDSKWKKIQIIHRKDKSDRRAFQYAKVVPLDNGVKLINGAEIGKITYPDGIKYPFSNRLFHRMKIKPEHIGKVLQATFEVKGNFYSGTASTNYLYGGIVFHEGKGKEPQKFIRRPAMPRTKNTITFSAPIPANATSADLMLAIYGCGEVEFTRAAIGIGTGKDAMSPDVIVSTSGYSDGIFCLPQGKSIPIKFAFRRKSTFNPKKVRLYVELPEGVRCTGYGLEMKRLADKDKWLVFDARYPYLRTTIRDTFCNWRHNAVLLESDLAPSDTKSYTMRYYMEADGEVSDIRTLQLKVLPFEEHKAPKTWYTGLHYPSFNGVKFDREASGKFVDFYSKCGFNYINARLAPDQSFWLRKANIKRVGNAMPMRNGYKVYGIVPDDESFIDISGKPLYRSLCPIAVYERRGFYTGFVIPFMEANLGPNGDYDFAGGNWEPYHYDYRGCFCRRCRNAFGSYAGIDAATLEKVWPSEVLTKYRAKWLAFRSWQHGKVVRTIQEDVRKAGKKDNGKISDFVPAISFLGFNKTTAGNYTAQYRAEEFINDMGFVCVWGPYAHKAELHSTYRYTPAQHLAHLLTVKQVNKHIRSISKKAVIKGLPAGSHVNWITTPEAIVFETIAGFVYGHMGSTPYWFAYDYRYYRAMARMNSLLAKLEPLILKGKESPDVTVTPSTPILEARHWRAVYAGTSIERISPEIRTCSALHAVRHNLSDGNVLISVANIWERSGVFFKLQVPGLAAQKRYAVENLENGETLAATGQELAKGVESAVKALGWTFLKISPMEPGKKYALITAETVQKRKAAALPEIRKAYAEEEKLLAEAGSRQLRSFDFGAIPEIRSGKMVVRENRDLPGSPVEVTAPDYTVLLDMENGGRISSWKCQNVELVPQKSIQGFGLAGRWMPDRRHFSGKCVLTDIQPRENGVEVTVIRPLVRKEELQLKSVYTFTPEGFHQRIEVLNTGKLPKDVMLRFHTLTNMLLGGKMVVDGVEIPTYPNVVFYRSEAPDADAEFPLRAEKIFNRKISSCSFTKAGVPFTLVFTSADLFGVLMWNTPGIMHASFEPTFKPVRRLAPGQSCSAWQKWEIKKK